jgi:hypothetical protein
MLLNYHIDRFVLAWLCVGDLVRLGLSSARVARLSLQQGYYSKPAAPNLQHTAKQEQNDQCGNSTAYSQAPDVGYINVRNMLST